MFNKKKIVIASVILAMAVAAMFISSYIRQNKLMAEYGISSETVTLDSAIYSYGCEIKVTDVSIWSTDAYIDSKGSEYESYKKSYAVYNGSKRLETAIVEVRINVLKKEDTGEQHGIYDLGLVCDASKFGFDIYMAQALNGCAGDFDMEVGESREYTIPFFMIEEAFKDKQWENLMGNSYVLMCDVWPVEKSIIITGMTDCMSVQVADTETEDATTESASGPDGTQNGGGEVYEGVTELTLGDFTVNIHDQKFIKNIGDIEKLPDTGVFYLEYSDEFDDETGEIREECEACYVQYSVDITNTGTTDQKYNIMNNCLYDGEDYYDAISGEMIYSSEYNRDAQPEERSTLDIKAGETVSYTAVDRMYGYYHYDYDVLYYEINQLGGVAYIGGGTAAFIVLSMNGGTSHTVIVDEGGADPAAVSGNGEVYDCDDTISLGNLSYKVLNVELIRNNSQLDSLPAEGVSDIDALNEFSFDDKTGDKIITNDANYDDTVLLYTIRVTNTGDKAEDYDIRTSYSWDSPIEFDNGTTTYCEGFTYYCNYCNEDAVKDSDEMFTVTIDSDESIDIIKVERMMGNFYDDEYIYIAVNPLDYNNYSDEYDGFLSTNIGSGTAAFIKVKTGE